MRRALAAVAVAVLAIVVIASCGRVKEAEDGGSGGPSTSISEHVASPALEISGISPSDNPAALVAAVTMPVGEGACAIDVETRVEYEADRIYLGLTYTEDQTHVYEVKEEGLVFIDGSSPVDDCERAARQVEVSLDGPLAGRAVITQLPVAHWLSSVDGRYSRCELPVCDPHTGSPPPEPACGDATLPDAVRGGDVPRRAGIDVRACELPWAVVDIDVGAGACPATGEPGNACAGKNIDRSYWRAADGRWDLLAYSSGPGCGQVLEHVPEFPAAMCADLPPVP